MVSLKVRASGNVNELIERMRTIRLSPNSNAKSGAYPEAQEKGRFATGDRKNYITGVEQESHASQRQYLRK